MNKFVIFLFALMPFGVIKAQETDQFKDEKWVAEHKIKSMKEWFFIPKPGTMEVSEYAFITSYKEYDQAGRVKLEDEYKEGMYLYTSHYSYNANGDKIEIKRIGENDSFISKDKYVYDYGAASRIMELVKNDTITIKFKYDDKQNKEHPVETVIYNKNKKVVGRDVFHYDAEGRVEKMDKYIGMSKLFYTKEFKFTESGKVAEELTYNADKSVYVKKVYKHNLAGHLNIELKYDKDNNVLSRMVYTIDNTGKPLQGMYYNKESKLTGIVRYEYKTYQL